MKQKVIYLENAELDYVHQWVKYIIDRNGAIDQIIVSPAERSYLIIYWEAYEGDGMIGQDITFFENLEKESE